MNSRNLGQAISDIPGRKVFQIANLACIYAQCISRDVKVAIYKIIFGLLLSPSAAARPILSEGPVEFAIEHSTHSQIWYMYARFIACQLSFDIVNIVIILRCEVGIIKVPSVIGKSMTSHRCRAALPLYLALPPSSSQE